MLRRVAFAAGQRLLVLAAGGLLPETERVPVEAVEGPDDLARPGPQGSRNTLQALRAASGRSPAQQELCRRNPQSRRAGGRLPVRERGDRRHRQVAATTCLGGIVGRRLDPPAAASAARGSWLCIAPSHRGLEGGRDRIQLSRAASSTAAMVGVRSIARGPRSLSGARKSMA